MECKILQWNCRSLRAQYNDLILLLSSMRPVACCLQELQVPKDYVFPNRQYHLYIDSASQSRNDTAGGAGVLVLKTVPHRYIPITTSMQAVACRISLHNQQSLTICSIYLPPSSHWDHSDLITLVSQLPSPVLLLGDFNAHSSLWGCPSTDSKGIEINNFLLQGNLCLMNNKQPTYIHPATGTTSSLDLSFCDPSLYLDYDWNVYDDLCGSDHFPVILSHFGPQPIDSTQTYRLKSADWNQFSTSWMMELQEDLLLQADDPIDEFTSVLLSIADRTIPKTTIKAQTARKPWFNDDCKVAIANRKKSIKQFIRHPSQTSLDNLRISRAKARRTIRQSKRDSWRMFVSRLTTRTPTKKVWNMIQRISGKRQASFVSHLKVDGSTVEQPQEIANTLASTISYNSSSDHYTHTFQEYKNKLERHALNFQSGNTEHYNQPFSMIELQCALVKAHDTAPGPDNVHYQMLKHLPDAALCTLLKIFNNIWETDNFPPSWSKATVIPLPKSGKDPTIPGNYRPIALTSCICKTFERMVNDRLMWYLESNGILSTLQSGFRKQRSTTDHLVRLESFIREGLVRGEHVVSVFFDLEKAYDTTWKYGIMRDLHEAGLRGRLPLFISSFLTNRQFQVRLGSVLSDFFSQEMGVPQGSILSVTLFILKINSIVNCLPVGMRGSLYVDDFLICYHSKNMSCLERQLQHCLNKIQSWANENGFQFSQSKTVCIHFCHKRIPHPDPELKIYNNIIPVVEETKFLGLIFDRRLTFVPHIKYLRDKCLKAINLLRVVSHTDWGADSPTLLKLYQAQVRSKLDYGCIVYGSARSSYIDSLDRIQNLALRICLGAFRTSPVQSLHVESHVMPLHLRRDKLALQYITKLRSNPLNPAYDVVFKPALKTLFETKPHTIPTLGLRMNNHIHAAGINLNHIAKFTVPSFPPWLLKSAVFVYSLHHIGSKDETSPDIYRSKFYELMSAFSGYEHIYTDGSKDGTAVAAAAIWNGHTLSQRLPDNASIFSAEARAVVLALDFVRQSRNRSHLILSDSLSCLQSIQNRNLKHPLILEICTTIHRLISSGNSICFMWVPSHIGITGNTLVDTEAKAALSLLPSNLPVPYTDFNHLINTYVTHRWQLQWNAEVGNKLHHIQPSIHPLPSVSLPRRDEILIHRLRVGHTHLTHRHLLRREAAPLCSHCHLPLTVEHILLTCPQYTVQRASCFNVTSIRDLFSTVSIRKIIDFVKAVGLYYKL